MYNIEIDISKFKILFYSLTYPRQLLVAQKNREYEFQIL